MQALLAVNWLMVVLPPVSCRKVTPYAADSGKWVLGHVGGFGGMLLQFLLIVGIVAAILYAQR